MATKNQLTSFFLNNLDAPFFLSLCNLKDAEPYYLTGVEGRHPEMKNRDYHSYFYLDRVRSGAD